MSSINPSKKNDSGPIYQKTKDFFVPPLAAAISIIPVFKMMIEKSDLQRGQFSEKITFQEALKKGFKASPTVGVIVGTQMIAQKALQQTLFTDYKKSEIMPSLISSAIVGVVSTPVLAIFNGQTMGLSPWKSLKRLSIRQSAAISLQEAAFVAGISAAEMVSLTMKEKIIDSPVTEYSASFVSGALGSLAGHPANTALTRWQCGMKINNISELMLGSLKKAKAIGLFSVFYKITSDLI
jgi:hypothetical protein